MVPLHLPLGACPLVIRAAVAWPRSKPIQMNVTTCLDEILINPMTVQVAQQVVDANLGS